MVLQENMLFNRAIHENIALADPAMPRALVIAAARIQELTSSFRACALAMTR